METTVTKTNNGVEYTINPKTLTITFLNGKNYKDLYKVHKELKRKTGINYTARYSDEFFTRLLNNTELLKKYVEKF